MKRLLTALPLAAILLAGTSCSKELRWHELSGYAQGGTYSVKFASRGRSIKTDAVQQAVDSILTLIDTTLSGYNKGSQLSRYNAGAEVEPNGMFKEIYSISRSFFKETEGALDVAAAPLFDAWGFGFTTDSLPSPAMVDSLLAACGMDCLDENMKPVRDG
ncbi:MAG: FAD:protein FMN transferase, partial [Bacteroidales bacterium]|nr:FAD:protein FMN transferase [Bacteroidales bacterium]